MESRDVVHLEKNDPSLGNRRTDFLNPVLGHFEFQLDGSMNLRPRELMKRSHRLRILFVMGLLAVGGGLQSPWGYAQSASESRIRGTIQGWMVQIHPSDTPEAWRSLGNETPSVIVSMLTQAENSRHRHRLLTALGFFPENPIALERLREEAVRTDNEVMRQAAIQAVGQTDTAREAQFVGTFLKSMDPGTRLAAARALRGMKNAQAQETYAEFLEREKRQGSWLADQLQGVAPALPKRLAPTGSTESRPAPGLLGTWKGYRLSPGAADGPIQVESVVLQVKTGASADGPAALKVECFVAALPSGGVVTKKAVAPKSEVWKQALGRGVSLSAVVGEGIQVLGELKQTTGGRFLELRSQGPGVVSSMLLRAE